ncbi:MAG: 4Fe-4S binding protein [Chloroflexi bacterium]|nr:4Fe-4S binding protein [Chloroflexota bacterium]
MTNLILTSKKKSLTPAALYRRRISWTQRARRLVQLAFATFILYTSVVHHLATEDGTTASIDALCPFGGLETFWRYLSSGGQYVPKTHASNLILFTGLLVGTLIAGSAFCGWICPFGAVQDLLTGIRKRLHLPEIQIPQRLDRILRYGRYVMLGIILYQTIVSVKLWFATIDPYRTLFGLDWLFDFQPAVAWAAYLSIIITLVSSLFVERAWCRYACPLGGALSLVGKFSLLRIRRTEESCKGCAICSRPCPVKLPVDTAKTISSDCIGCLECVDTCPRPGALEVKLAPVWLDRIRKENSDVR